MMRSEHTTDNEREDEDMSNPTITIIPNDKGNPPGKVADAELHWTDGILAGLKLIGFAVWESRTGHKRLVTFPARQYSHNGERRSFAVLRPSGAEDTQAGQQALTQAIIAAYDRYESELASGARVSGTSASYAPPAWGLDDDAPPVPAGLRPRDGVTMGCGKATCTDCYEPLNAAAER